MLGAACSSASEPDEAVDGTVDPSIAVTTSNPTPESNRPVTVPPTTQPTPAPTAAPPATTPAVAELVESRPRQAAEPGIYRSDVLPLSFEIELTAPFRVSRLFDGLVNFEPADGREGPIVGLFSVDTMLQTTGNGVMTEQLAATPDLSAWADGVEHSSVDERGSGTIGGIEASWWAVETGDGCASCYWAMFETTGRSVWGTSAGFVQQIWAVDAPGNTILVSVEAPVDQFDDWVEEVDEHLLAGLVFGEPTGHSRARPRGEEFGPYAVGRAETVVIDSTRPTLQVMNEGTEFVPADDERRLLISLAYPSDIGGFGSTPVDGPLPLVVVAPALGDFGMLLPTNRALASHGYVVATVRFPESSFPGGSRAGVPEQPADVSVVLDHVLGNEVPAALAAVIDPERIGLVGWSGGATTGFGLLQSACCVDDRLDAVVAHAGTPYDFESEPIASEVPVIHIGSLADVVIPTATLREFYESVDAPSSWAMFEFDSHLAWLTPGQQQYLDAFTLTQGFLDLHVAGDEAIDMASIAAGTALVEYEER